MEAVLWGRGSGSCDASWDILQALKSGCPFWPDQPGERQYLLTLIPATVDGKPFCLDFLGELIQHPKGGGRATKYDCYWGDLKDTHGSRSPDKSYWVLLSRDVIEGTRGKNYADQCKILETERQGMSYEVPGALEAVTSILMEHVWTGQYLFGQKPWTFLRCRERVDGHQGAVGGFGAAGLSFYRSSSVLKYDCSESCGLAGSRRF